MKNYHAYNFIHIIIFTFFIFAFPISHYLNLLPCEKGLNADPLDLSVKKTEFTESEKKFIREHNPLVFSEVNWKPLSIVDHPEKFDGMIADYFNLITLKSGLKFKYIKSPTWNDVLHKYVKGEIDIIPAMDKNDRVDREIVVTQPFITFPMVIVTRENVSFIKETSQLIGKRVAVGKGYTSSNFLQSNYPGITRVERYIEVIDACTEAKKIAKQMPGSSVFVERRLKNVIEY